MSLIKQSYSQNNLGGVQRKADSTPAQIMEVGSILIHKIFTLHPVY